MRRGGGLGSYEDIQETDYVTVILIRAMGNPLIHNLKKPSAMVNYVGLLSR